MQPPLGSHIDVPPEKVFQVGNKSAGKEEAAVGPDIDEKIDIAIRSRVAARHRSGHTNVISAMPRGDAQDFFALFL